MNPWSRRVKSIYRKEPLISFLITGGAINVALGSVTEHWSLMSVGLSVVGIAIALWVQQSHRRQRADLMPRRTSSYILPPAKSTSLPPLTIPKSNPPR